MAFRWLRRVTLIPRARRLAFEREMLAVEEFLQALKVQPSWRDDVR